MWNNSSTQKREKSIRCGGNALQNYLATWNPSSQKQPTVGSSRSIPLTESASVTSSATGIPSFSGKRVSAFVRPQQTLYSGGAGNNSSSPFLGLSTRGDIPFHPGLTPTIPPPPPIPSASGSLSDSFNAALPTILPYHPAPMWASSNVFYHFALPPTPSHPTLAPHPSDLSSSPVGVGASSSASFPWSSRPFHLPTPTGCTVSGCQDCNVFTSHHGGQIHPRNQFQSGRLSNSNVTSTFRASPSAAASPFPLEKVRRSSEPDDTESYRVAEDPDSPGSLHVESSSNSIDEDEGDNQNHEGAGVSDDPGGDDAW